MRARSKIRPLDAACTVVPREMRIGAILAAQGKLDLAGIEQVVKLQQARGLRFGEADLRPPRQFEIFNIPDRSGLSAVLSGRAGREAAVPVPAFGPLSVLPAGAPPPNPQELLLRPSLAAFLEAAENEYDLILIDTPPAQENADAQCVAFRAGSVLVLARTNHTRVDDAAGLIRDLGDAGALVVGTVLNTF